LADVARLRRHTVAEVCQHALEQHADHYLVLDDEDAFARSSLYMIRH
jgi:hypothetical protein